MKELNDEALKGVDGGKGENANIRYVKKSVTMYSVTGPNDPLLNLGKLSVGDKVQVETFSAHKKGVKNVTNLKVDGKIDSTYIKVLVSKDKSLVGKKGYIPYTAISNQLTPPTTKK